MKRLLSVCICLMLAMTGMAQSKVYFTKEITPESLVKIYKALGVEAQGRVCVKISTGEGGNTHYLKPTLIRNLVEEVNGTIVECCTHRRMLHCLWRLAPGSEEALGDNPRSRLRLHLCC